MIQDTNNNEVVARDSGINSLRVRTLLTDMISPTLVEFVEFNGNEDLLVLSFSEPMDINSIVPGFITFHSAVMGGSSFNLTSYVNVTGAERNTQLTVQLADIDARSIRFNPVLAINVDTTYISLAIGAFTDIAGNDVSNTSQIQVTRYAQDVTAPTFERFSLDIDSGILTLEFDEIVNAMSLNPSALVIHATNETTTDPLDEYRLTDGMVNSGDNEELDLVISGFDIGIIKSRSNIAQSLNTTFISFSRDFVLDLSGISVNPVEFVQASNFTDDNTSPFLASFSLNISSGILTLVFNEYVIVESFHETEITLLAGNHTNGSALTLTGGTVIPTEALQIIVVQLSDGDLDVIKDDLSFSTNQIYISITEFTVTDGFERRVIPIPLDDPQLVSEHIPDLLPPIITDFALDLNTGILTLTFNEVVNETSFNVTKVRLVGAMGSQYDLIGGIITTLSLPVIELTLIPEDLNNIKADFDLAVSQSTTAILPRSGLVSDTAGNYLVSSILPVTTNDFTDDTNNPELVSYSLDLDSDTLILTFNETVDTNTLNVSELSLQSQSNTNSSVALTGSTISSSPGPIVEISIGNAAINEIKRNRALALGSGTTYISFEATAVNDSSSNPVIPINFMFAQQVLTYIDDQTPPKLIEEDYALDLNANTLTLIFDETVDVFSVNFTLITISSEDFDPAEFYTLTGGSIVPFIDDPTVIIEFSFDDINAIKSLRNLAISASTTFLTIGNGTVADMAGNIVEGVQFISITPSAFTSDNTAPMLLLFDLVMTNGTEPLEIILRFSESIDVNSLSVTGITLHLSNISNPLTDFRLTDGSRSVADTPNITVFVIESDLNEIRALAPLGQSAQTSYISLVGNSLRDIAGRQNNPQGPLSIGQYLADLTPPFVWEFSLNMNSGILILTFQEVIQYQTIDITSISLQATNSSGPNVSLAVPSNLLTVEDDSVMAISISTADLNAIKQYPSLAFDENSTFLVLDLSVKDIANNPVEVITSDNALKATSFVQDTTPPRLDNFDFDLMNGVLTLRFDETVNATSILPNLIQFTNINETLTYTLTDGSSITLYSTSVVFNLSAFDHNGIKAIDGLANLMENTYINLLFGALRDMNMNPSVVIRVEPTTGFTHDAQDPALDRFTINVNSGEMVLSFDETVNVSSLQINDLLLHNANGVTYALTDSYVNQAPLPTITVFFSENDLNELKRLQICLRSETCFLSFPTTVVSDMVARAVIAIDASNPQPVAEHIADVIIPVLVDYVEFNFVTRIIVLEFSETINASSFDPTEVVLQSFFSNEHPTTSFRLTNASILTSDNTTVVIELSETDLFAIKDTPYLCDIRAHCYIVISNMTTLDMSGNPSQAIPQAAPGSVVSRFVDDVSSPALDQFGLDMNSSVLSLTFSEPIEGADLDPTGITIVSMPNASIFERYQLTGGQSLGRSGDIVVMVVLSTDDVNTLKASTFAKSSADTYLTMLSSTVTDVAFTKNPVVSIDINAALPVSNYVTDSEPPTLTSYSLDLNTDQLVLDFSEPVLTSEVIFTSLVLQNDSTMPIFAHTLTGGTVLTPENASLVLTIELGPDDITVLKLTENFGTNETNTFLSADMGTFKDTAGNPTDAISGVMAAFHFRDTTRPELLSFSINMQTGQLNLTFSDVVSSSSLDASAISIQNSRYSSMAYSIPLSTLSTTNSSDGYGIIIDIHPLDLLQIKSVPGLAVSNVTTWIVMQAFAIDDAFGADVLAVTNGKALQVSTFIPDTLAPTIDQFIFDLDTGSLNITFSDTIDHLLLNVSLLTITSDIIPTIAYPVDQAVVERSSDGQTVIVSLSETDLNRIKNNTNIGTGVSNTYLAIGSEAFVDLAGNYLPEIPISSALSAMTVVLDMTGPELRGFELDLNAGELVVTFSEPVDSSTVFSQGYILQSKQDATFFLDEQYTLLTGVRASPNGPIISIAFGEDDLNGIFAITALGNTEDDSYLIITNLSVRDIAGNPAIPVPLTNGVRASIVLPDTNPPRLLDYSLDMDTGILTLYYTEVVLTSSIRFSEIQLQNAPNASESTTVRYSLTNGITPSVESKTLNITFTEEDLYAIQALPGLATQQGNTYLSFTNLSAMDAQSFPVIPISSEVAMQVGVFVADTTDPELTSFDFDLNTGYLNLTFNEVVNRTTTVASRVELRNSPNVTSLRFPLTGSIIAPGLSHVVSIDVGLDNLNDIKKEIALATSLGDTYLNLLSSVLVDAVGNTYSNSSAIFSVAAFIPDTTSPVLRMFWP